MRNRLGKVTGRISLAVGAVGACLFCLCMPEAHAVNSSVCGDLMEQYSIVPYHSWGSTPADVKKIWGDSDCNHKICAFMKDKYDVVPHKSWGSLPGNFKKIWDDPQVNCNAQLE